MTWTKGAITRNLTTSSSTTSWSAQEELLKSKLNHILQQQQLHQQQYHGGRYVSTLSSSLVSSLRHFSQRIPTSRLKERLCQTRNHEFLMKKENKVQIESLLDKVRDVVDSISLTSPKECSPMDRTRLIAWTMDVAKVLSDFTPSEHHHKDPLVILIAKLQDLQDSPPLWLVEAAADARHLLEKWERIGLFDDSDTEDSDEMDHKSHDEVNTVNTTIGNTQDTGKGDSRHKRLSFVPQMLKDRRRASSSDSRIDPNAVGAALTNPLLLGPQTSSGMIPMPSRMEMSLEYQRIRSRAAERVIKRNIIKWSRSHAHSLYHQQLEEVKTFGSTTKTFIQKLMYRQQRKKIQQQQQEEEEEEEADTQRTHQSIFFQDLIKFSKHMSVFAVDEALRQVEYTNTKRFLFQNRCAVKLQAAWKEYKNFLGRRFLKVVHETKAAKEKLGKLPFANGSTGSNGGRRKSSRLFMKQPSSRLHRNSINGLHSFATSKEEDSFAFSGERRRRKTVVKPTRTHQLLVDGSENHPASSPYQVNQSFLVDADEKEIARLMARFGDVVLSGYQGEYNQLSEEELEKIVTTLKDHETTATTADEAKDMEQFRHLLERRLTNRRLSRLIQEEEEKTDTNANRNGNEAPTLLDSMDKDCLTVTTSKNDDVTPEEKLGKLRKKTIFQADEPSLNSFEIDPENLMILGASGGLEGPKSGSLQYFPHPKRASVMAAQTESAKRRSVAKVITVTNTNTYTISSTVGYMKKIKALQPFENLLEEKLAEPTKDSATAIGSRPASKVNTRRKHLYELPIDQSATCNNIMPLMEPLLSLTTDTQQEEELEQGNRVSNLNNRSRKLKLSPRIQKLTQRDRLERLAWLKARMKNKSEHLDELQVTAVSTDATNDPSRGPSPKRQVQEIVVKHHPLLLERLDAASSKNDQMITSTIAIARAEAEQIAALIEKEAILIAREAQLTPENFRQFLQELERDHLIQDVFSIAQVYEEMLWVSDATSSQMCSQTLSTKSSLAHGTTEDQELESTFEYGISKKDIKEWKRAPSTSHLHQPKPPLSFSSIASTRSLSPRKRNRNVKSIATRKAISSASYSHTNIIQSHQAMCHPLSSKSPFNGSIIPLTTCSNNNTAALVPVLSQIDTNPFVSQEKKKEKEEEEEEEEDNSSSETEEENDFEEETTNRKSPSPVRSRHLPSKQIHHAKKTTTTRMKEDERQAAFELLMTTYRGLLHTPRENLLKSNVTS